LEGASAGRPVLSTDHIGCRDTFDDGISGIMFAPRSVEALIEAIEKFIHLPYNKKITMGLAGRKKVEKEFDRELIVNAYMQAVGRIIGQKAE
jgi:galacturonosyltransferase